MMNEYPATHTAHTQYRGKCIENTISFIWLMYSRGFFEHAHINVEGSALGNTVSVRKFFRKSISTIHRYCVCSIVKELERQTLPLFLELVFVLIFEGFMLIVRFPIVQLVRSPKILGLSFGGCKVIGTLSFWDI